MATIILDTLEFCWLNSVSVNDHRCLTLFELVLQNVETVYHLYIIDITAFALCDVMAQSILVRKTGKDYYLSNS